MIRKEQADLASLPNHVIKVLAFGKCPGLVPVSFGRSAPPGSIITLSQSGTSNGFPLMEIDADGLCDPSVLMTPDKTRLMSGISDLIDLLDMICVSAVQCGQWFVEEDYIVPSLETVLYDPEGEKTVLIPHMAEKSFCGGIIGILKEAEKIWPWTCADLMRRDIENGLADSGAAALRIYFRNLRNEMFRQSLQHH